MILDYGICVFGHLNFGSLKFLARKKLIIGLPCVDFSNKKCESCILEKKYRDPFSKGKAWRANRSLELIHSDLCTVEVPSNGSNEYFITFIDDFSKKTWVYFLRNKSDACDVFKKFKYYLEKQSGYFIKILRTDRGTTYLVCDDYLVKNSIKHQLTVRYTPQQNGVTERKNRIVMDMVRSMMHSKDHLRKKLDDKTEKCIFIGYNHETKGYKLFNSDTEKVIVSRDVTFDEHRVWDWSRKDLEILSKYPSISLVMGASSIKQPIEPVEISSWPQRECCMPRRFDDYIIGRDDDLFDEDIVNFALFADYDTVSFNETVKDDHWIRAMDEEIYTIEKNDTWELTTIPPEKKPIGVKIGSLRYLTSTRPDITYGVGLISRFMESPCQFHLQAAKRILKYVQATQSDCIFYSSSHGSNLIGYTDIDWVGDTIQRRSTSGYAFYLGFGVFSWFSKKQ
ncbi:uncharacterized protein [Coffea arabica]|uniref:Integrase catalytic domain-containing protein n=1 Tax=Coffea arabica TaxID=13443 RepID=A0ABM4WQ85_COFAR